MMVDKKHHSNVRAANRERVLPQAFVLVKSSLLQGQALQVGLVTFLTMQYRSCLKYHVIFCGVIFF
jgi:hypothetical protein